MKNLIIPIALGIFLFTSCSKDESLEQTEDQTSNLIHVLEQNLEQDSFRTIEIDNFTGGINYTATTRDNDFAHCSGLYMPGNRDATILSWSGNRDNTGTYGYAELQITKPSYSLHIVMETECITLDGNKAVYGAIITDVIELRGNAPQIGELWRFYFQVTDNKLGFSTVADQISSTMLFASPRSHSLCATYPPNHDIWSSNGRENVLDPGFVEVSRNPE